MDGNIIDVSRSLLKEDIMKAKSQNEKEMAFNETRSNLRTLTALGASFTISFPIWCSISLVQAVMALLRINIPCSYSTKNRISNEEGWLDQTFQR